MEKIDKTRGFSVRETKLDNGQVKLKLAVLPVPKRDQPDSSSSFNPATESCTALPDHCSSSEQSTPAAPASLPDNRGKWRPIGFTPVDQPAASCPSSEPFLPRSNLSTSSSASLLLPSSTESTQFLSCFGAAPGVFFDPSSSFSSPSSLKPFQIAAVVKPATQPVTPAAAATNFISPVNQLYRSASAISSHAHPTLPTFKLSIFNKDDRLVSSGSDTDDLDEDFDFDKEHSPFFSSLASSSGLTTESTSHLLLLPETVSKKQQQKPASAPSRKKRREVDDLLNTWNVAPTAGKLLRQEKVPAVDSNQRVSRRSAAAAAASSERRSPRKSPFVSPTTPAPETRSGAKSASTGRGKKESSAKSSEEPGPLPPPPPRPLVTQEQIEAAVVTLNKVTVSPAKIDPSSGRPSSRAKSFKFLSNLSPDAMQTVTRKRFCSSVVVSRSEEALSAAEAASSTQLPPKKRHKQLSPIQQPSTQLDAGTLSKLAERQSAAIAFLRPSLFDLKKEHEERMRRMRPPVTSHCPIFNSQRQPLKSSRIVAVGKQTTNNNAQSKEPLPPPPLKLKISLSKIMASRSLQATSAPEKTKLRPHTNSANKVVSTLKKKAKMVVSGNKPATSYGLRTRRSSDVPVVEPPVVAAVKNEPPPQPLPAVSLVSRGRGRPRKDAVVVVKETVPSVVPDKPRGRGRPPKQSAAASPPQPPEGRVTSKTPPSRKIERKTPQQEQQKDEEEPLAKLIKKRGRRDLVTASKTLPPPTSPPKKSPLKIKVEKTAQLRADGKVLLKRIKSEKKFQLAGIFSDTFKEERTEPLEIQASEMSSLASPTSEFSGSGDFCFSPMNSPLHQQSSGETKYSGAVLPLPPPAALSVLYERSYFELPHDLWLLNKHGLLNRPTHPGENFRRVRNNVYTPTSRHVFGQKAEPPEPCQCKVKDDKICTDDCINKQLFVECSAESCPDFTCCANRRFQQGGDLTKIARFETKSCGSGVKAKKLISKGDFIIEYTGEVVGEREFRRRMVEIYAEDEHHYAFNLEGGAVIDAYRMGSLARFVNHSCEPNCQMQKWTVLGLPRVGLFALKDIQPGEELSYDYNFNWFDEGSRQVCRCGSKQCRGFIGGSRRNSICSDPNNKKPMIQPLEKWRLSNLPKSFSVREWEVLEEGRVILRRNVRSMSRKLNRIIAAKKAKKARKSTVVIAQPGELNNGNGSGNSLFMAQFQALSTSRSVSTRCLSSATESDATSKSVEMALFLEQLLTSLMMHRDSSGNQTSLNFITLPRRKQNAAYYDRVVKPIDFSSIERNITAGRYPTFDSFNDDVRLLLDNVKLGADLLRQQDPEKTFCELADTYDKLLRNFEPEIAEFRRLFPSAELEDVVRCVCGRLNEEGTMVQCEKCQLWQHTDCVGVNMHSMPDSYSCPFCSSKSAPANREIPLPAGQLPPDAQPGCHYYLTLCTKTGLQVRVDECYTINRQSLPFDVPFCKIDKLYTGIFYVDRLFIDPSGKRFIYGVHLVYPFEVHVDHSRRFFPKEVLATLWYDKLPIEIISGQCWVLDSSTYARGRPRAASSEELVFICDNGLDKHAKAMHKLNEPMATVCTKRYGFDYFLVPLRPERNVTAGEIHERMFAVRRDELAKQAAAPPLAPSLSVSSDTSTDISPSSDDDDELPLSKLGSVEIARKRSRLNKIAEKLAEKMEVRLDPDVIPDWLIKPGQRKVEQTSSQQFDLKTSEKIEKKDESSYQRIDFESISQSIVGQTSISEKIDQSVESSTSEINRTLMEILPSESISLATDSKPFDLSDQSSPMIDEKLKQPDFLEVVPNKNETSDFQPIELQDSLVSADQKPISEKVDQTIEESSSKIERESEDLPSESICLKSGENIDSKSIDLSDHSMLKIEEKSKQSDLLEANPDKTIEIEKTDQKSISEKIDQLVEVSSSEIEQASISLSADLKPIDLSDQSSAKIDEKSKQSDVEQMEEIDQKSISEKIEKSQKSDTKFDVGDQKSTGQQLNVKLENRTNSDQSVVENPVDSANLPLTEEPVEQDDSAEGFDFYS